MFLVLAEIGEADRIFGAVEKSWDDDDLPLSMADIEQLALANRRDDQANARFYQTQYTFLLRELRAGIHIDYASNEEIPLEYIMQLPPAVTLQNWSRVYLPRDPEQVLVRRKFALGNTESEFAFEDKFLEDVDLSQTISHSHIAPIWASYTAKNFGYTLTTFVGQHTLRSFLDHRGPAQFQRLEKPKRRYRILDWLHCMCDAIVVLHRNGLRHGAIWPGNIIIDEQNNIAFSDIGSLSTFQQDKKLDPVNANIYSAPEMMQRTPSIAEDAIRRGSLAHPADVLEAQNGQAARVQRRSWSTRSDRKESLTNDSLASSRAAKADSDAAATRPADASTTESDVFSLGCIFLEMVTFLLKKKPHDFVKHRSSKVSNRRPGSSGRGSRVDSSYHANPDKVESWMNILAAAASTQEEDAFRAIPDILDLIRTMLSVDPQARPRAHEVRDRLLDILLLYTAIPTIHCDAHRDMAAFVTNRQSRSDRHSTMTFSTISTASDTTLSSASSRSLASSDGSTIRWSVASGAESTYSFTPSVSTRSEVSIGGLTDIVGDEGAMVHDDAARFIVSRQDGAAYPSRAPRPDSPTSPTSPRSAARRDPAAERVADGSAEHDEYVTALPTRPSHDRRSSRASTASSSAASPPPRKVKPWAKPFVMLPSGQDRRGPFGA